MLTQEQEYIIRQSLVRGVARNRKDACEVGCAALRRQLQELLTEEEAKQNPRRAPRRKPSDAIHFNVLRTSLGSAGKLSERELPPRHG